MTLGLGCASSTPWKAGGPQITASELLAGTPLETTPGTAARCGVTGAQVLALNPEMRAFVEEHVSPAASPPTPASTRIATCASSPSAVSTRQTPPTPRS